MDKDLIALKHELERQKDLIYELRDVIKRLMARTAEIMLAMEIDGGEKGN